MMKSKDFDRDAVSAAVPPMGAMYAATQDAFGPQYDGDNPFTKKMRFHQSWYRAEKLRVPCGTGPVIGSAARYGNMLRAEDGAAGKNFLTPEIFAIASARIARSRDRVEPFRLYHNMLSSQPLCFNIFGPLAARLDRATRLLQVLFPEVNRVLAVEIEYAPGPPQDYLDDRTSFDAFVDFESRDGTRGFLAFETKLTDSFSPKRYDKPAYRRWMEGARSTWRQGVDHDVADGRYNQLWRNHLLAIAMRDRPGAVWTTCRSIVLRHPDDAEGYRAVAGYASLLREGESSFGEITLDRLVAAFEATSEDAERAWLRELRLRYLDLDASAPSWNARRR